MKTLIAGVDCSTQSTKVVVVDADSGEIVATGGARHAVTGTGGERETHPDVWWEALCSALGQTGLADQIAVAQAREEFPQAFDAAGLRDAARDPVDGVIAAESVGGGVGVGRLAVVHVEDLARRGDPLLAVRQAGIAADAADDLLARTAQP